ncbi:MAG: polysaccharide deacetylase family protein [Rhodocyclaceae bacterium]|nr:MAG: polysaccharide deacetylase family protein [Rhodocyclaceae bacterium]
MHRVSTLIFGALAIGSVCFGAETVTPVPTLVASESVLHSPEQETTKIRMHHLNRLSEHLTKTPETLRFHCRYESDIATLPPSRQVALTFDDGPEPGQTEHILEILAKYRIHATFFLIGSKAAEHPELVEKIKASGQHIIGNHSWNHPNFHDISEEEQANEIKKTTDLLEKVGGYTRFFRYPYGNSSCEANALLHSTGYAIVGWHIDSCDWAFDKTGVVDVQEATSCGVLPQNRSDYVEHVVASVRAHNGGIVLMHEIHANTVKQLDHIIARVLADGFVFSLITAQGFQPSLR